MQPGQAQQWTEGGPSTEICILSGSHGSRELGGKSEQKWAKLGYHSLSLAFSLRLTVINTLPLRTHGLIDNGRKSSIYM